MDLTLVGDLISKVLMGLAALAGAFKVGAALAVLIKSVAESSKIRAEAQNSIKSQDFDTYKNTVDTLQKTIAGYASQIERVVLECEDKMNKYQARIDKLENELAERTETLNQNVAEILKLRNELEMSNQRIRTLEKELIKRDETIKKLEFENCQLRQFPTVSRKGLATE